MREHGSIVLCFDSKHGVGKNFLYYAMDFDMFGLSHFLLYISFKFSRLL